MSEFRTHWKGDVPKDESIERILTTADLTAIVSSEYLRAISNAGGGFTFEIKESLGPGDPIGYTDRSRRIFLNPHYLKKFSKDAIRGIITHETGHHALPVVEFQNRTIAHINSPEFFPKEIPDDPELRAQLRKAAFFHLTNVLADVWLEAYMTRGTRKVSKVAVDSLYHEVGDRKSLLTLSPADQLAQLLVGEDRYPGSVAIKEMVAPEVFTEYTALKKSGAIAVMNNNEIFDDPFANELDKKRDLDQKFIAYRDHFFPAWLRLIEKKIQEQKEQKGKGKGGKEGGEGEGEPEAGQGKGGKPWDNLTPEDIEAIKKELEKMIEAGKEFQPLAPGTDEENNPQMKAERGIQQGLEDDQQKQKIDKKPEEKPSKPEFDLNKRLREFRRERKKAGEMAQAQEHGVTVETIREYEQILRDRADDIESAAAAIAEVFMEDRAMWTEYGKREGEITAGLEYEHISELESGNPSPKTHSRRVRHPDFIETEIEFITDVSGSMSGEPINKSIELQVVLCEAFRRARETLAGLQMLAPNNEEPVRMGATKFEAHAERIKKLDDPNSVDAQLAIIENLKHGGGGTNEEEALEGVYGEFKLRKPNVLKIIIVLSDGEGNREAVRRIMAQIEEDDEVVLAAVGLGGSAKSVVDAYTGGLRRDLADRNIYGFEKEDVTTLLPDMLEFLKTQVRARRRNR